MVLQAGGEIGGGDPVLEGLGVAIDGEREEVGHLLGSNLEDVPGGVTIIFVAENIDCGRGDHEWKDRSEKEDTDELDADSEFHRAEAGTG